MGRRGLQAIEPGEPCSRTEGAYCPDDAEIDAILCTLHDALRRGVPDAQLEIDTYLFAAAPQISAKLPRAALRLPPAATVRFESLPNIQERVVHVLVASETDNSIAAQFLRQCMPLKRRTKRAQRDIVWTPEYASEMRVLVRCCYGTFFGLYPSCSKFAHFAHRVALNALLHAVLVADAPTIAAFCNRIGYTLRIAVMEHCCQTISTFCPALVHTLNKKKQFFAFCSNMYSVGDAFRAEMNKQQHISAADKEGTLAALVRLEHFAQTLFERCSRAFRTVIQNPPPPIISSQGRRAIASYSRLDSSLIARAMQAYVCTNKYIFSAINSDVFPGELSGVVWQLLNNTRVCELPVQIALQQMARIAALHGDDFTLQQRQSVLQVCVLCALKNGYSNHMCSTRYDAVTRKLTCIECRQTSIVHINLVGRVLYIGARGVVLSLCCATPIMWSGDGTEWNTTCGDHCSKNSFQRQASRRRRAPPQLQKSTVQCYVCSSRVISHSRRLLHMQRKGMHFVHFCSKHAPPVSVLNALIDTHELNEFLDPTLSFMRA